MNNILCITGMHRSGTSLIASWLEHCGLNIHNGNVIGPHIGNSKGHFEDKDFVNLHSSAILAEHPMSKNWQVFVDKLMTFSDGHLSTAKKLVSERNEKFNNWGWKDPRSVLFLEQWKAIIPDLKVLLIWRPCSEVVRSLIDRSKGASEGNVTITTRQSIKLWTSYNQRVCKYKAKYRKDTILLPLHYLLTHDSGVITLIRNKLGANLEYQPINGVYQPELLQGRSRSEYQIGSGILSMCYRTAVLEKQLLALSEIIMLAKSNEYTS